MVADWSPFDQAPRDGTRILAYTPPRQLEVKAKFGRRFTVPRPGIVHIVRWFEKDGSGCWSSHYKGMKPLEREPSHFMTLPLGPEGQP